MLWIKSQKVGLAFFLNFEKSSFGIVCTIHRGKCSLIGGPILTIQFTVQREGNNCSWISRSFPLEIGRHHSRPLSISEGNTLGARLCGAEKQLVDSFLKGLCCDFSIKFNFCFILFRSHCCSDCTQT